jgi:CBS domain-containing protein
MKARDIMRKRVLSVKPQTTLKELARLLAEHHVSGVPVLGTEGDLIGVVSQTDLVRREHEGSTVATVMTPWTVSFEEDTEVKELARQMLSKKIHRVIVTRDGRLSGIITSMDMVRALLVLLEPSHEGTHRDRLLE